MFGASGTGKTSLLRAGVIPRLSEVSPGTAVRYAKFQDQGQTATLRGILAELDTQAADGKGSDNSPAVSLTDAIIILDRFEKVLLSLEAEQSDAERFAMELADARRAKGKRLKIVFCLREDFQYLMPAFQAKADITFGPRDYLRLQRLTLRQAVEVLRQLSTSAGIDFDERVAERLIREEIADPADGRVSPVDLQAILLVVSRTEEEGRDLPEPASEPSAERPVPSICIWVRFWIPQRSASRVVRRWRHSWHSSIWTTTSGAHRRPSRRSQSVRARSSSPESCTTRSCSSQTSRSAWSRLKSRTTKLVTS